MSFMLNILYVECPKISPSSKVLSIINLNVVNLSAIMLNIVMLSVVLLNIVRWVSLGMVLLC